MVLFGFASICFTTASIILDFRLTIRIILCQKHNLTEGGLGNRFDMCPVSVQWLKTSQQSVEALRIFPFLDEAIIDGLKAKLPAYLAATEDVVITQENTEERKVTCN